MIVNGVMIELTQEQIALINGKNKFEMVCTRNEGGYMEKGTGKWVYRGDKYRQREA